MYRDDLRVPHLRAAGLLVNSVPPPQSSLHSARIDELGEHFPDVPVLTPVIPLRARIAEVQDAGEPLSGDCDLVRSGLVDELAALGSAALQAPVWPVAA